MSREVAFTRCSRCRRLVALVGPAEYICICGWGTRFVKEKDIVWLSETAARLQEGVAGYQFKLEFAVTRGR